MKNSFRAKVFLFLLSVLVFCALAFLSGCGQPPIINEANRLALRAAQQALKDNSNTNEAVIKAFRDLMQADLDRVKAETMKKLVVERDGKAWIDMTDLAKYNALVIEKQAALDAAVEKIKRQLAENQINGEIAVAILAKLVEVQDYRDKRPTLPQDGGKLIDDILDLYGQIKAKKPNP